VFALAIVSFIVDQNTGDTTGPPYHDSLLNHIAFFVFFGSAVAFVLLATFTVIAWTYARSRSRATSA
jgi:hypothetical protein